MPPRRLSRFPSTLVLPLVRTCRTACQWGAGQWEGSAFGVAVGSRNSLQLQHISLVLVFLFVADSRRLEHMFDMVVVSDLKAAVAAVSGAPAKLATPSQSRDTARTIQASQDTLDAAKAAHLANLQDTRGFEEEGYSSLTAWAREELRLSARDARTLVAAGNTLTMLPLVKQSASEGKIRLAHVKEFTFGLRHVSTPAIQENEDWLLDVAQTCDEQQLHQVIRKLRDAVFPDDLDRLWVDGMDKEDIAINAVPNGWHITGFLGIQTGAKFKTVLGSLSAPRNRDDNRPASERRVDALDNMLTSELEHGLPTDLGIRPQLNVLVDLKTFVDQQSGETVLPPIELSGFGPIGPKLASYLVCNASVPGILADGETGGPNPQLNILNVGRACRLAIPRQRKAVLIRQHGICAAPGCTNTHLEIHHVAWWSKGGTTILDNLIGLCSRCHHLLHRELIHITADGHGGFEFTDKRAINRSNEKHIHFAPPRRHQQSELETRLTLIVLDEQRKILPRHQIEYTLQHANLPPPQAELVS